MISSAFKAYDIRGRMPDPLNDASVAAIALAFAEILMPKRLVLGADARPDSPRFAQIIGQVMQGQGVEVLYLPLCGTEEVYFHTDAQKADLGMMVTASHNPIDYNGIKFVGANSKPIMDKDLVQKIAKRADALEAQFAARPVQASHADFALLEKAAYVDKLLSFVDIKALKPIKIVCTSGNGAAGPVVDLLEPHLPFELIKVHHEPDPSFPNGIPNPLLPDRRAATSKAVQANQADMGIAFDGDFDRCFFFDAKGRFIEGYYVVGLIAKALLDDNPGEAIVYDPRLTWATQQAVTEAGGRAQQSQSGHSFIKMAMREHKAIYGGEMSAHHYFRDFAYCDTGMVPWLLLAQLMSKSGQPLAAMVDAAIQAFPCSGELNFKVSDADATIAAVVAAFGQGGQQDLTDGIGMDFPNWRFNIRKSNTEPLVRLNVEARDDAALMQTKTQAMVDFIQGL